ncbi:MAG: 2Fe-2S iron-sulfur cluster-binding protein [Pseudomonadota bacterium]
MEISPETGVGAPDCFTVCIAPADWCFSAPAHLPLLQAAEAAGITLPSSCRNGTCRTCLCTLQSGQIAYGIAWPGLSAEEKAEGLVLPCVAYPLSDVVLRQPAARRAVPPVSR